MAYLLVDNSNSRTKFALGHADRLTVWRDVVPTAEISHETLSRVVEGLTYSGTIICSVVPEKAAVMKAFFEPRGPLHFLNHESPFGMAVDYPNPEQIGADRFANAAGIVARHHAPAIVIDFGTAVTFDVISAEPAYCGGVIAPGLGAMSGYLTKRTALLPQIELEEPTTAIGKSTVQAMQAGAVYGYRGMVREIIREIQKELPGKARIVATGGDAALIAQGLPEIELVDPNITLDGLRFVARRVFG
ncbi:MAG: type III pantothenate kinase [Verrucomicrobiales bacterium]|nr:type III pantothenate kinase [Verrucomicrobiota bacterium JB025]